MDATKHPNSHIIFFRRKAIFDVEARPELNEYFADSKIGIGSYFGKGSTRTATGLSISEENLLMPYILAIPSDDREFRKQVNEYFQNIDTKVPADSNPPVPTDGKPLEIGLEVSNSEPVSKDNLPIKVEDFVRWRQCMGHPWVEASPELAKGNQLIKFYQYDPKAELTTTVTADNLKDQALAQYLTIKANNRLVRMYLTLLGINVQTLTRAGEDVTRLRMMAETKPKDFLLIVQDKDKEMKYLVEEMINFKILDRIGSRILNADGGKELGRDMKETILYLSDTHNTKELIHLKAKLQNEWKKRSISVELEEDLSTQPEALRETDDELARRLKVENIKADPTLDAIDKASKKTEAPKFIMEEKATGLDIKVEPEPEVEPEEGTLGSIEAGSSESDVIEGETTPDPMSPTIIE